MSRIDYSSSLIWIPCNSFTCLSSKLKTEFTSLIAKSIRPGLSDTTFFAHCWGWLVQRASTCKFFFQALEIQPVHRKTSIWSPSGILTFLIFPFFHFSFVGFILSIRFHFVTSKKIISLIFLLHSFPKWWHHLNWTVLWFFVVVQVHLSLKKLHLT